MRSRLLTLALLLAVGSAHAACLVAYHYTPHCCNAFTAMETVTCTPPSLPAWGARLEGFTPDCRHVKLTAGDAYISGYTHTSQANLTEAAETLEDNCCGETAAQIGANCTSDFYYVDWMPAPLYP